LGATARWWLHESLHELNAALAALGGELIVLRGVVSENGKNRTLSSG
ncbi:hypothetical protein DOT66_25095, partial [Ralstonia pseudosolanacearum]